MSGALPSRPAPCARHALAALGLAVFALVAAACGGGSNGDTQPGVTVASTVDTTVSPSTAVGAAAPATTGSAPAAPSSSPDPTADGSPDATAAVEELAYERIVVSDQLLLDAALALDLPVIGIPGYADRESIPAYLSDEAGEVVELAERTQVNLEALAAARPDLLLFNVKTVDASGVADELARIAPLVALDADTSKPWRDVLRQVAAAVGVPERADARIAAADAAIEAAAEVVAASAASVEVSVVRCFADSCRYLPGGTSFSGQVLDELGVARPEIQRADPEGRAFVEVSPERYDLLGGDIILLFGTDAEESIAALESNPLWQGLAAVQAGEVYAVDPSPWFGGNVIAVEYIVADVVRLLG